MKEKLLLLVLMIVTVPLAGELKLYPFHDTFRVSFGTPTFFFFLLWIRNIPLILSGFAVGISVVAFRIALDWSILDHFQLETAFMLHFPVFFYYLTYSFLFRVTRIKHFQDRPLLIGFLAVFVEVLSNAVEFFFRYSISGMTISVSELCLVMVIAIIRSFFVLGFFNIITIRQVKLAEDQQRKQNEHMLMLISNLYEESFQLKKSMQQAESITRDCYDLYRNLQDTHSSSNMQEFAQKSLRIAGQVHEIKKDNQRIHAGLAKMISDESPTDYMSMEEIGKIIVGTNQKYAQSLNLDIQFRLNIDNPLPTFHAYTVLSLINNLVANAVESIKEKGIIKISINKVGEWVEFRVYDNGSGIPPKKRDLVFTPGYTTKYDVSGKPSTGVGLAYVKEMVENLNGHVTLQDESESNETVIVIQMPLESLLEKG